MTFAENLKNTRRAAKMKQEDLAKVTGITARTISAYETGERLPRSLGTTAKLAKALGVEVNALLADDERFIVEAGEHYGVRGARQAKELVDELCGLFAGGDLDEADRDEMMKALMDAYWIAKEKSRKKFTPKKYREDSPE